MSNAPNDKAAYIATLQQWPRADLLRICRAARISAGALKTTHDIAEVMWERIGRHARSATHNPPAIAPQLSAEQEIALRSFAATHGRTWKSALQERWSNGWRRETPNPLLQEVRNTLGPTWLATFKL